MNQMKKITLLLGFVAMITITSCGPTIYKSDNFETTQAKIKTLAIIPFSTSIDSKRLPKDITLETLKQSEEKTGYDVQNSVYTYFLQRNKDYSIEFQDVDRTNAILRKNNLTYSDIALKDRAELCQLLGVDGVVTGKISMSKPMSEGAAVAVGLLVGAWGATNKTDVTISVHDKDAKLQWKYDYQASGSVGSSSENLAKSLMKNASKKFPYKRA
jgi:curli biogenesis system outer membrane secretion channel CsgG